MAVKSAAEVTITDNTDIDSLVTWYYLTTSATKPAAPTTTQTSVAPPSPWTQAEPTFAAGTVTNYLYTCVQTRWKDGSCTWGAVQLSSSYEQAKQAWNKAQAAQDAAADGYSKVQSRGEQLVTNGNGMMGDNTNFTSLSFDGSKSNGSPGSFTHVARTYMIPVCDEFFPVDASKDYIAEFDIMASGPGENAKFYAMLMFYDVDKNQIVVQHVSYFQGSTTTLARDLNNGDTVVYLTSVAGFKKNVAAHQRTMIFWDYTNSKGYTYPPETYSRNLMYRSAGYWEDSGINASANTITLSAPYSGPTHAAGTPVSQNSSGGTYSYFWSNSNVPADTWTHASGTYSGTAASNPNPPSGKFWEGAAYAKIGFLWNCQSTASNLQKQLWVTNISVMQKRVTSEELSAVSNVANTALNRVTLKDTRNDNQTPQWYFTNYPRQIVQEFKFSSTMELTGFETYCYLETLVPWADSSGGWPKQVATVSGRQVWRIGTSATTWGAWTDAKASADAAAKTASDYITEITSDGIMVHAEGEGPDDTQTPTGWHIADALEYVKSGVTRFWIGLKDAVHDLTPTVIIGKPYVSGASDNESHMELDYHSLQLIDKELYQYFYVSDLRDSSGEAVIYGRYYTTDLGTPGRLTLPLDVKRVDRFFVDDSETECTIDSDNRTVVFNQPASSFVIDIYWVTESRLAKAYTVGIRDFDPGANATVGPMSVALGIQVVAAGYASVAEGGATSAVGDYSHAEGCNTGASGEYSHAEGWLSGASGRGGHAEGYYTSASGKWSHSEGYDTTASGDYSHAEGYDTEASGARSHAQNSFTVAASENQTAIGKYNIEDANGVYAAIIGNGNVSNRSNALAVRWNGLVDQAGETAYPTFTRSSWSTSSNENTLPVTPCFVLSLSDMALYYCSGT